MAHGRPQGFTTLYDADGNPISVFKMVGDSYRLAVEDEMTTRKLDDILEVLTEIRDLLSER